MSIRHPKRRSRDGEVVDLDDLNENFKEFHEEVEAKLNHHNFANEAFSRAPAANQGLAQDVAMRCFSRRATTQDDMTHPIAATDGIQVPSTGAWEVIGTCTFISRGGMLWVTCSGQANWGDPGAQVALSINGAVVDESATSTIDHEVEVPLDPSQSTPDVKRGIHTPGGGSYRMRQPFVITALQPIPPGRASVALLAMSMQPWNDVATQDSADPGSDETKRVWSYEIVAFELQ